MPIKEKSIEDKIKDAIKDEEQAMLENVLASKAETDAKVKKQKAHFKLQKARERLNELYQELMSN